MLNKFDRDESHQDLIGELYDAALDPSLMRGISARIAETYNASSAVLVMTAPQDEVHWLSHTANYTDDAAKAYVAHYHTVDVWAQRAARMGLSRIFVGQELIADADFVRTEFYQDWCRERNNFHVLGTVFEVSDKALTLFGVHRPHGAAAYTDMEKGRLGAFLAHLKRALQVRQRLLKAGIERKAALDMLERMGLATLVVGRDGNVLYANREAVELMREADALRSKNDKLTALSPATSAQLLELIRGAVDTASARGKAAGGVLKLDRAGRLPLTLLVAPFRPARDGFGAGVPAALVFIKDPESLGVTGIKLQGLFDLTAMEACIAAALCEGQSLNDIARAYVISINTVKTHLKSILGKTETSRQAELVALLLRSMGALRDD